MRARETAAPGAVGRLGSWPGHGDRGRCPRATYHGVLPSNAEVGAGALVDSSHAFKQFRSRRRPGLRIGDRVTLWRASVATEADGVIEIGDDTYVGNASLVAAERITLGARVLVSGGATVVDSDFHPLSAVERIADSIALAPGGDRSRRPAVHARPVVVEDDVWIGWNGVI